MSGMGRTERELLAWIADVAQARDSKPRAKTVTLKFTRATLRMWLDRVRETQTTTEAQLKTDADYRAEWLAEIRMGA